MKPLDTNPALCTLIPPHCTGRKHNLFPITRRNRKEPGTIAGWGFLWSIEMQSSLESRFWSKVIKSDGCWKWTASKTEFGYGQIEDVSNGKRFNWKAPRLSWFIHHGQIPDGFCVLHKCDNPECTNPDHLYLGTKQDNVNDMKSRGRSAKRGGLLSGRAAKLTPDKVARIRYKYFCSIRILAKEYGVHKCTVVDILNGATWKDVPTPRSEKEIKAFLNTLETETKEG